MNRRDMGLVVRFEGGPWDGQWRQMETATDRIDVPILADDLTVESSETDTEPPRIIQGYYILVSTATEASHGLCRYGWFSDPARDAALKSREGPGNQDDDESA